jgi:L-alanine-DL-glutamate epimerase-like enolase superfamily enzyme
VSTWDRLAGLPLDVEDYTLEDRRRTTGEFTRATTTIHLRGRGEEGLGEDVVYAVADHDALQQAGPVQPLAGQWTLASFCDHVGGLDLFPQPPDNDVSRRYRRWAFESAALDLALRQAGVSLAGHLGLDARPVNFVVSMRLSAFDDPSPDRADRVHRMLESYPTTRFKLDPTNSWTPELVDELVATGAVDSLDLKGQYSGTPVDVETDPELYRLLIERFPDAWLEDPDVNDQTKPLLDAVADRVTWDAPIHAIADIESRPWQPRMINIKPSRFGPLRELFAAYDYCRENGISAYGGGQFELGPGRGHIQYLASLFHADTPNDVAPSDYNRPEPPPGLPVSPLDPRVSPVGFRWDSGGG